MIGFSLIIVICSLNFRALFFSNILAEEKLMLPEINEINTERINILVKVLF